MKKYLNKFSIFGLGLFLSLNSFASNLKNNDTGFEVGENGELTAKPKGTDYSGDFFTSITDFIGQWQNGLIWVFVGVAILAFIVGLYKYVANPDISTVVVSLITMAIFIMMAIQSRKILARAVGAELDLESIKLGAEYIVSNIGL